MSETTPKTVAKGQDAAKVEEKRRHPEPAPGGLNALAGDTLLLDILLGSSVMEPRLEGRAALLGDPRLSHPANAGQKVQMVSRLQAQPSKSIFPPSSSLIVRNGSKHCTCQSKRRF